MKIFLIIPAVALSLLSACGTSSKEDKETTQAAPLSEQEKNSVITSGKEIAENTFKVLGGNLKKAMGEGGVENAINYCNANASNLMGSLSNVYSANIRRTSNKLRNEHNAPTASEQKVLDHYINGSEMKPITDVLPNGNKIFYAPIKMKPLCLSCHGTVGESISEKDYKNISNLYPDDKAIGYKEGDFRGIWSIELKK